MISYLEEIHLVQPGRDTVECSGSMLESQHSRRHLDGVGAPGAYRLAQRDARFQSVNHGGNNAQGVARAKGREGEAWKYVRADLIPEVARALLRLVRGGAPKPRQGGKGGRDLGVRK